MGDFFDSFDDIQCDDFEVPEYLPLGPTVSENFDPNEDISY